MVDGGKLQISVSNQNIEKIESSISMSMELDIATFETIIPSRFLSFTIPLPTLSSTTQLLRVAILDSPIYSTDSPQVAALIVPQNRESDWVFSTESCHLQLLLSSPGISRLNFDR